MAYSVTQCVAYAVWQGTVIKTTDVNRLQRYRKRVRPLNKQRPMESRCLWHSVTEALRAGDTETAATHKRVVRIIPYAY